MWGQEEEDKPEGMWLNELAAGFAGKSPQGLAWSLVSGGTEASLCTSHTQSAQLYGCA